MARLQWRDDLDAPEFLQEAVECWGLTPDDAIEHWQAWTEMQRLGWWPFADQTLRELVDAKLAGQDLSRRLVARRRIVAVLYWWANLKLVDDDDPDDDELTRPEDGPEPWPLDPRPSLSARRPDPSTV